MLVAVKSFKVAMLNFHWTLGYDSDTDDGSEKGNHSPPAKRQKLECIAATSPGSPSSSNKGYNQDEKCLPFLLTSVRGIGPEFNARNTAIGIKGMCSVFYRVLDLCPNLRKNLRFSVITSMKKSTVFLLPFSVVCVFMENTRQPC